MEKDELSEDEGLYELSLSTKSWPRVIQKLGGTSPGVLGRKEYLGSERILAPSRQLHTTTVSCDIYLNSMAVCKFFLCVIQQ